MRKQRRRLDLRRVTLHQLAGTNGGLTGVRSYHAYCSGSCDSCDDQNPNCWTGASCACEDVEDSQRCKAG